MEAKVLTIDGKEKKRIKLPEVFETPYKPSLIRRAVIAIQSHRLQPKGNYYLAGRDTSAEYVGRRRAYRAGINRAMSRLPRTKPGGGGLGHVARVPHAKGGIRAHPPRVEKEISKKINKKEKRLALQSAIAATANPDLVRKRGHLFEGELPIVVEEKFETFEKTKDISKALGNLGLGKELERGKERRIRAGKGKIRGRKYKRKKSILIVTTKAEFAKAIRNIPGVDVILAKDLNPEILAPGGDAGRLTVWTEPAIKALGGE